MSYGWEADYISAQTDPVPSYLLFDAFRNPTMRPVEGTIYSKLDDEFSIFKSLVDKTRYRFLMNDLTQKMTVLAFPDKYVHPSLRESFKNLDISEAVAIVQCHILAGSTIDGSSELGTVKMTPALTANDMLIPTLSEKVRIQTKQQHPRFHVWGTGSEQMISFLNNGSMFKNGVVIVISEPIVPLS